MCHLMNGKSMSSPQGLNPLPDLTELAQAMGFTLLKADGPYGTREWIHGKIGKWCFRPTSHLLHVRAITHLYRCSQGSWDKQTHYHLFFLLATDFFLWDQSQLQLNTQFPEADLWRRETTTLRSTPIGDFFQHWTILMKTWHPVWGLPRLVLCNYTAMTWSDQLSDLSVAMSHSARNNAFTHKLLF